MDFDVTFFPGLSERWRTYRKVMFALNCCQSIYFKVDLSYRFIMSTCTEERTGSQNALIRATMNERAKVRSHPPTLVQNQTRLNDGKINSPNSRSNVLK